MNTASKRLKTRTSHTKWTTY